MIRKDRRGQVFGRLTAIALWAVDHRGQARWMCECACGEFFIAVGGRLAQRGVRSCGCLNREVSNRRIAAFNAGPARQAKHKQRMVEQSYRHGHARKCGGKQPASKTYNSWYSMIARCENPNHEAYDQYGGRGIVIYKQWRDDFRAFLADMGERPVGMTLDREDPNGNYEPGNCRWATPKQQRANQRVRA